LTFGALTQLVKWQEKHLACETPVNPSVHVLQCRIWKRNEM